MRSILFAALLLFSACGPLNQGSPAKVALDLVGTVTGLGPKPEEQPLVTPELANADEILFVTIRRQGAVLPMTRAGTNGDVETWIAANGATVALESGILVASRGLGFDLSGADPNGVRAAILAGGGTAQRTHGFLNPLDQVDTVAMACTITELGEEEVEMPQGLRTLTKFDEECAGAQLIFKNEYWTDSSGEIVRSLQVLTQEIGFLLLEKA